jgi:hypothetical protein
LYVSSLAALSASAIRKYMPETQGWTTIRDINTFHFTTTDGSITSPRKVRSVKP